MKFKKIKIETIFISILSFIIIFTTLGFGFCGYSTEIMAGGNSPPSNEEQNYWNKAYDENGSFIPIAEKDLPEELKIDFTKAYSSQMDVSQNGVYQNLAGSYKNFNCYAFALGRTEQVDIVHQDYAQYGVGAFSGNIVSASDANTIILANAILKDLHSTTEQTITMGNTEVAVTPLNKKDIYWTIKKPNVSLLDDSDNLFCFRIGRNSSGQISDYHLMKYDKESGKWLHKMGGNKVVYESNNEPSEVKNGLNQNAWTSEILFNNEPTYLSVTYNGTIVYFKYKD